MPCQLHTEPSKGWDAYSERRKRICADFKATPIDPSEKLPEHPFAALRDTRSNVRQMYGGLIIPGLVVQNNRSNNIELQRLSQDGTTRHRTLVVIVSTAQFNDNLGSVVDDVRDNRRVALRSMCWLEAQNVGEDSLGVFSSFERE